MAQSPEAHDVQAAFAAVLVDEWVRAGVTDAVVSPGSRSTPLLVALAEKAEQGRIRLHVVLDERSAGFIALGLGRASGHPAVVATTSGTAAVELHPAVVEADEGGVPLLAVTADRPPELHDCGAPQTVRQVGLFGRAARWELSPGVPDVASMGSWRSIASRAVAEAVGGARRPGPVHLNLAFREPLLGSAEGLLASVPGRASGAPWHRVPTPVGLPPPPEVIAILAEAAAARAEGLIVAGAGCGGPEGVWELARATGWPILAEPASGCRWPGAIGAADALLRLELVRAWRPHLVLRLGAPWLSKTLGEWLRGLDCLQVLVDQWATWAAPDRQPSLVVASSPSALCLELAGSRRGTGTGAGAVQRDSGLAGRWSRAEALAQEAIDATLAAGEGMTEPGIVRELVRWAPGGSSLVVSSSMPVREVEWWSPPRKGLRVIANRGANGIDGALSTALGVALATGFPSREGSVLPDRPPFARAAPAAGAKARTLALLGDLAFAYDCTALLAAAKVGARLDVIVLDNDGGGIFNFLPQADNQPAGRFERLWGVPHGLDLCAVARSFGAEAEEVGDWRELLKALEAEPLAPVRVLVARTDRASNVGVHRRLHEAVAGALAGSFDRETG